MYANKFPLIIKDYSRFSFTNHYIIMLPCPPLNTVIIFVLYVPTPNTVFITNCAQP